MASAIVDAFVKHVQPQVPGFRVRRKEESWLMRVLNKLLFFTPDFMDRYTTTVGNTVYLTENLWSVNSIWAVSTLAHEARHVYDKRRFSMGLFGFGYLFPQILGVLAFLAFFSWWFLAALAFLAPIPAFFRMRIERQGYLMTLCVSWWISGEGAAWSELPRVLHQFTGPAYYFMWPFRNGLEKWFRRTLPEVARFPSRNNALYILVFDFITANRLNKGGSK